MIRVPNLRLGSRLALLLAVLAGLQSAAPGIAVAQTVLHLRSEPGDYVGGGQETALLTATVDFRAERNFSTGISLYINNFDRPMPPSIVWWEAHFAAPSGVVLVAGAYEDATRWPFQEPSVPGLSIYGNGNGCNTLTGRFDVHEAVYESGTGRVLQFAVDFEQHCEGAIPALFGSIRFNSNVALPTPVAMFSVIRASDIQEARNRVNALRTLRGLGSISWTDPALVTGVTEIKAVHFAEIRAALADVYAADGLPLPVYSNAVLDLGDTIRAADINELTAAIAVVE